MKAEVQEKVATMRGWSSATNFEEFSSAVDKYYNRAGTEFSAAYWRLLRYSIAEAILQALKATRSEHLPTIPSERPTGYDDVRLAVGDHGGRSIEQAIVAVTRSEYELANEMQGASMPPVYINRLLERWTLGLTTALQSEAADITALGDYLEGRYDEYYEVLRDDRCGRTWLTERVTELANEVYGRRYHEEFIEEYELSDAPWWVEELMNGDD